jgi:tetratricopeptide (TPR) repeat protein
MRKSEKGRFGRLDFSKTGAQVSGTESEEWANMSADACAAAADDLFCRGRWEPALAAYSRALRFDRDYTPAWTGQVRCLIELGEHTEAVTWAARGIERFGNNPELLAARGLATVLSGDIAMGVSFLDGAVQQRSPSAWVWIYRARVLVRTDPANGRRCLLKARELAAADPILTQQIGKAYLDYRLAADAIAILRQSDQTLPGNAYTQYQLGRAYEEAGDKMSARTSYERAIAIEPLCYPARDGLDRLRRWNPIAAIRRGLSKGKTA